jgi:predicted DNA binding CopG/RHH family protein
MLQAMQQPAAASPTPPSHSFVELLAALEAPDQQAKIPGDISSSQGWQREPAPPSRSFAELLAALAAPPPKQREPAWSDDGLADDYATLSYEHALRAHVRYRSADPPAAESDSSLTGSADPGPVRIREAFSTAALPADSTATPRQASGSHAGDQPQTAYIAPGPRNLNLKSASITIRLSQPECAQLRKRAAEAGLTVSAYLRSCTFEAESLRALVKDTLAQLRSEPSKANRAKGDQAAADRAAPRPIRRSWRQWWARLWPWTHSSNCMARA